MPYFSAAPLPKLIAFLSKIICLFNALKVLSNALGEPSFTTITMKLFCNKLFVREIRFLLGLYAGIKAIGFSLDSTESSLESFCPPPICIYMFHNFPL